MKINFDQSYQQMRLDIALSKYLQISRAKSQALISKQLVLINDKSAKSSYLLQGQEVVTINNEQQPSKALKKSALALTIVYQDDDVLIINKPSGLVVHPGAGHQDDTLVNALANYHLPGSADRPGIVHRLDKDTSGLLIVAKNEKALNNISKQFHDRQVVREYLGLVKGELIVASGQIKGKIGRNIKDRQKMMIRANGKEAFTNFSVVEVFSGYSLVKFSLVTGRTHQIRVHMNALNYPLVGDRKYGDTTLFDQGQLLHCFHLAFISPSTNKMIDVSVQLPDYFENVLQQLRGRR